LFGLAKWIGNVNGKRMHRQKYEMKELKGEGRKNTCPLIQSSPTQFDVNRLLAMSLLQSFPFIENSIKKIKNTVHGYGLGKRLGSKGEEDGEGRGDEMGHVHCLGCRRSTWVVGERGCRRPRVNAGA
jgi:hypothetical protein